MTTSGETVDRATEVIDLPLARVTQQFLSKEDGDGNVGDCLRACVASLVGFEPEQVPHFALYGYSESVTDDYNRHGWWWALVGFMDTLEPSFRTLVPDEHPEPSDTQDDLYGCYLASGKSPRGDWEHCVVARGGEVIWDPHPSRAGVDGPLSVTAYFVRRDSERGHSGRTDA